MLEQFETKMIDTGENVVHTKWCGNGPPLLLSHGFPETHLMWHKIAPRLARDFTVVLTDLPGYGDSSKPVTSEDHEPYSKRAMARDMIAVMGHLGFDKFSVAGHDRGGRMAYRLALDHPECVEALAVLDLVPTGDAFNIMDVVSTVVIWPFSFLAQPYPFPEDVICACPEVFLDHLLKAWSKVPDSFNEEVRQAYLRQLKDRNTVHAICEEYRAAATLDYQHDEADRGNRRIECPLLVLWSAHGLVEKRYGGLSVWKEFWSDDVSGRSIDCGHFLPEEAPDETYEELRTFFLRG